MPRTRSDYRRSSRRRNTSSPSPSRLAAHYMRISPVVIHPLPIRYPQFDISLYWHERNHEDAAHRWFRGRFAEVVQRA